MANAIDLSTLQGLSVTQPAVTNPALQKAYLVAWLLVLTDTEILDPGTQLARTDIEVTAIRAQAAASPRDIDYVDMRNIYPRLAPMTQTQVDNVLNLARSDPHYSAMAVAYWNLGVQDLNYSPAPRCLGTPTVLALN